jgi:uncharacterized protein YwqG
MIEGIDYCFIYPKEDEAAVHIKLLDGPYKDTTYKYGRVSFEEKDEQVYLQFKFDVIESTIKTKILEKDLDFKNYIGDLLVEIMSSNIEQEIIDETGTIDSKESGL